MIRSMTGFGRQEAVRGPHRLTVEMRAVNHRFCEVAIRLPKAWSPLEDKVKKRIAERVRRGRVDVTVTLDWEQGESAGFTIDWDLAERYVLSAQQLLHRFSLSRTLSAHELLSLPGVLHPEEPADLSLEEAEAWLEEVLDQAADDLVRMKRAEGEALALDIKQRLTQVVAWTEQIRQQAPTAVEEYRKRLAQRVAEIARDVAFAADEQRIAQEVTLFAERSDISEETTRLLSHCDQFHELLDKDEAVGRKLDFLLQEMNREANTIASKAHHLPIQRLAVEIKTELEKIREQVQNIE